LKLQPVPAVAPVFFPELKEIGAVKKFGVEEEFIIYLQIKIERFKYYESR